MQEIIYFIGREPDGYTITMVVDRCPMTIKQGIKDFRDAERFVAKAKSNN